MVRTVLISICLIITLCGAAQDARVFSTVSQNSLAVNETFTYEITLENGDGNIVAPDLRDFEKVRGPATSRQQSWVNGKFSGSISHTYTLRAKKLGKYTLAPAKAKVDGQVLTGNSIDIEVTTKKKQAGGGTDENFYTKTVVSDRSLFVGESAVLTYKLYLGYDKIYNHQSSYPQFDGFLVEDIPGSETHEVEIINGRQFIVYDLHNQVIIAQRSGKFRIEPMEISASIAIRGRGFLSPTTYKEVFATGNTVTVTVEDLPKAEPPGFVGTFDDLKINVDVSRTDLGANESIDFNVKFSGRGNLKILGEPTLEIPSDFEHYEPKIKDNIAINKSGINGSRTFEYVFIPRSPGEFTIPEMSYTYFDPGDEKFKTLNTTPQTFRVGRGSGDGNVAYTFDSKTDVNVLNQDIRYIRPTTRLSPASGAFFGTIGYYGLMALPLILLGAALGWKRRREAALSDMGAVKQKRAGKMARKHLSKARQLCNTGNSKEFFMAVHAAILGYISDKFTLPLSELNNDKIKALLTAIGSESLGDETSSILELCERARYAPVNDVSESELLAKAETLIQSIESQVKA